MSTGKRLSLGNLRSLSQTVAVTEARSVFVVGAFTRAEAAVLGVAIPRSAAVVAAGGAAPFASELHAGRVVNGSDLETTCAERSVRPAGYDLVIALRPDVPKVASNVDGPTVFSMAVSLLLKGGGISAIIGGGAGFSARMKHLKTETSEGEPMMFCTKDAPADCPCRKGR